MNKIENFNNICIGCMKEKKSNTCNNCDFDEKEYIVKNQLRPRVLLNNRYLIGKKLDENGEGNGYLGLDIKDNTNIYIREFMPGNLCQREKNSNNIFVIPGCEILFREYMDDFLNSFKNLQRLNNAKALFKIYEVFEENKTAYVIFEWVEHMSLREFMDIGQKRLDWNAARPMFMPIISTLIEFNKIGLNHLAICTENIVVLRSGEMKLKGFSISAVRQVGTDLVPELYRGCSAIEQYTPNATLSEVTDVYSFSATLFFALTGVLPNSAVKRQKDDRLLLPQNILKAIPMNILTSLADGLQVSPSKRTQSLETLRDRFSLTTQMSLSEYDKQKSPTKEKQKKKNKRNLVVVVISSILTLLICGIIIFLTFTDFGHPLDEDMSSSKSVTDNTIIISDSKLSVDSYIDIPNIVGKTIEEAQNESDNKYEIVKSEEYNDNVDAGKIISQSPVSDNNTKIPQGSVINVIVSKGAKFKPLPDITGLTISEASQQIANAGFNPVKAKNIQDNESIDNIAAKYKDYSAGDLVESGSNVEIISVQK